MSGNSNKQSEEVTLQTLLGVALEVSERLGTLEQQMKTIPLQRHTEEHEYLRIEIERRKAQRDFWLDIHKKLATAGIIGAFGLMLSGLGYAFTQWVKSLGP